MLRSLNWLRFGVNNSPSALLAGGDDLSDIRDEFLKRLFDVTKGRMSSTTMRRMFGGAADARAKTQSIVLMRSIENLTGNRENSGQRNRHGGNLNARLAACWSKRQKQSPKWWQRRRFLWEGSEAI